MEPHDQEDIKIDMKLSKYKNLMKELANEIDSLEEPNWFTIVFEAISWIIINMKTKYK